MGISTTRILGQPEASHFQGLCGGYELEDGLLDDVDDEIEDGVLEDEEGFPFLATNSSFLAGIMNLGSEVVGAFTDVQPLEVMFGLCGQDKFCSSTLICKVDQH